jgi:hypothetical protein
MSYTVGDLLNQLSVLRDENRGLKAAAAGAAAITEKALERLQRAEVVVAAAGQHAFADTPSSRARLIKAVETYEENRAS